MYIGAARCIAMVLVWTAIAGGDQFLCVSLVLLLGFAQLSRFSISMVQWNHGNDPLQPLVAIILIRKGQSSDLQVPTWEFWGTFKSQGVLFVVAGNGHQPYFWGENMLHYKVGFFKNIRDTYQLLKCRFLALKVEFCDYCHHLCSGGNAPWCGGKGFRCECPGRCELSHSAAPPAAMVRETGQDQPVGGFK